MRTCSMAFRSAGAPKLMDERNENPPLPSIPPPPPPPPPYNYVPYYPTTTATTTTLPSNRSVTFSLSSESPSSTTNFAEFFGPNTFSEFAITQRRSAEVWESGVNKSPVTPGVVPSPPPPPSYSSSSQDNVKTSPAHLEIHTPFYYENSRSTTPVSSTISSEFRFLSDSNSPGIPLASDHKNFFPDAPGFQESGSWKTGTHHSTSDLPSTSSTNDEMIIEEVVASAAASKAAAGSQQQHQTSPRSITNSLDSLSELPQIPIDSQGLMSAADRSQSLDDLLLGNQQDGNGGRNGSYDTLMLKGLTDSGIGGGLRDENFSQDRIPTDFISSPDGYSPYPSAVSFASYDPSSTFSNENTNPLDTLARGVGSVGIGNAYHDDQRKQPELPAISEESEHEQTTNNLHSSAVSVDRDRDVIEHSYPMAHCNSAPSNAYAASMINNNISHRRVVSDDVAETTRLKRSVEMENMNRIGQFGFDQKTNGLKKKGRCKSLMFVVQGNENEEEDEEHDDTSSEEEDLAGTKDNDMLILNRMNDIGSSKRNSPSYMDRNPPMISSEPPPVRLSRKVSASTTRSTPLKSASDQSWKDKMPPFAMSSHTMFSPQSLPSRDAIPRSPFDGAGTISSGTGTHSNQQPSMITIETEITSPDGGEGYNSPRQRLPSDLSASSPPSLLAELNDELPPLSSIYRRTTSISSTTTEITLISPERRSVSPNGSANSSMINNTSHNSSFVRRSLRKIMKRSPASTSAIPEQYIIDGPRGSNSLKRRASAASSSLLASAQAHLKPRAKSLKKQSWMCTSSSLDSSEEVYSYSGEVCSSTLSLVGKTNKKEKSGSDTFTFGNLFRKKQQPARANLQDIISDLDQRSAGKQQHLAAPNGGGGTANRRSTSASILPMSEGGVVFETSSLDGLPDHISRMVSPTDASETISIASSSNVYLQLERLWGKYDLFSTEEYQSWHEKYRHNTLSSKQVKKQDAIYELYMMEKRQCANIAFLLQGYRRRMLEENIITKPDMDIFIPDVLEPLLMFHLNILERFTERMKENFEVSTISDIIAEELSIERGKFTKLCCDAYTAFGAGKERSDILYHQLMAKSSKFSEFFRRTWSEEPLYKNFEFRPLITKIIGRATKYSLLLETILKNEQQFSEAHDLTQKALEVARQFAHKIDENLTMAHMSSKWDEIKAQIDPSSHTALYVPDPVMQHALIRHHFDVDALNAVPTRKLVHIGEAFVKLPNMPIGGGTQSSSSGKSDKIPAILVLFDDIIVILCRKGGKLHFVQDQSAMPVKSLLTRTSARGSSIMLISGGKPVLFEISFLTTSDRKKWVHYLEAAPKNVPEEGVRLSQSNEEEMLRQRAVMQQQCENQWLEKLNELFRSRYIEEETLSNYLETRLKFFDDVRSHMSVMPFKTRHDISDRVREAVRGRFRELRRARTIPLNRLVDRMGESRDADLWSFFDEKADAADVPDKSSELSDDSSSSGNESNAGTSRAKPRRIQTFHGTSQPGAQSAIDTKNGIRRHTTVPRMNSDNGSTSTDRALVDDEEEEEQSSSRARGESQVDRRQYEEMMAKLPLRQSLKARRASTKLIKEVIALRKENHLLRSDNALTKSRCALLERCRGGAAASSTATAVDESMEMLRKKEKEIREMQRQMFLEKEDLLEKQRGLEAQELEIQSKWAALQQRSNDSISTAPMSPMHSKSSSVSSPTYKTVQPASPNIEWSPVLASLATKTETKKLKK